MEIEKNEENIEYHKLYDSWSLWAHLPHDTLWTLESYKLLYTFNLLEEGIELIKVLPDNCIKNCMLFIMRKNITPTWEDENNKNGGCFSFKISNKYVKNIWENLVFALIGENIFIDEIINHKVLNGITISPKKNFCIIKIWLNSCEYQDIKYLNNNINLLNEPYIFKKHIE